MLIVDDLYTIIGSANINDRSQARNRDSEVLYFFVFYLIFKVCLLITDHEFIDTKMNYQPYKAGKFAFSLRKRLMMEHLGLLEGTYPRVKAPSAIQINVEDPISNTFYEDIWCRIAESNTRIYEEVFKVFPTNLVCFLYLCVIIGVLFRNVWVVIYARAIVFTSFLEYYNL